MLFQGNPELEKKKNKCVFIHYYKVLNQSMLKLIANAKVMNQKSACLKYSRAEKIRNIQHVIQEFADLILRGTASRQASAEEARPAGPPKV